MLLQVFRYSKNLQYMHITYILWTSIKCLHQNKFPMLVGRKDVGAVAKWLKHQTAAAEVPDSSPN